MPRPHFSPLHVHFFKGFLGGMQWETQGEETEEGKKNYHFLLHHPHSFRISKIITRGLNLPTPKPMIVSLALRDIYEYATLNIHLCCTLEPAEFFGRAKNAYHWARPISDEAFWAFTYKAFHARALFLGTVLRPGSEPPVNTQPMVKALDTFREVFFDHYSIDPIVNNDYEIATNQEDIERVNDDISRNVQIRNKYFPHHLTHHTGQGDGTDKFITIPKAHKKNSDPKEDVDLDFTKIPDEELFYYDTECKAKHEDTFKDIPKNSDGPTVTSESSTKLLNEVKQSYDAFLTYRESKAGVVDEEPEEGDGAGLPNEVEDEAEDSGDELPNMKRLKISNDGDELKGMEASGVEKLNISDD